MARGDWMTSSLVSRTVTLTPSLAIMRAMTSPTGPAPTITTSASVVLTMVVEGKQEVSCGTAFIQCSDLWGKLPVGSGTRVRGRGNFSNARLRFLIGLAAKAVIFGVNRISV